MRCLLSVAGPLLAGGLLLLSAARAAETTISDTLFNPDGTVAAGALTITNPPFVSAEGKSIGAASKLVTLASGVINISLEANDTATPAGTSYRVSYEMDDGRRWVEFWVVPTGAAVKIGTIRVTTAPTPNLAIALPQLLPGGGILNDHLVFNGSSWTPTPLSGTGITSLNGLSPAVQTFAIGVAGTNFAISSAGSVHTFDLPDASAANRGALTSADWSDFDSKAAGSHGHSGADITSGVVALVHGGTGADLSATGGANEFVRQSSVGGVFTVSAIVDADVPNTITLDDITQITTRPIGSTTGDLAASRVDDGGAAATQALFSGAGGAAGFRAIADADLPSEIAYEDETNVFTARQDIDDNNPFRLFEPDVNGTNFLEFLHGNVDRTVNISLSWENIVGPCTGANGGVLTLNGTAPNLTIDCEDDDAGGGASHDMLSATHTDTLAAAVVRGGMMVGNATPAWALVTIGGANTVWGSDGTDPSWESTTGTGNVVRATSPTIVTPVISSTGFTTAQHPHAAANSGGQIPIGNTTGDLAASRVDDGGAPATQALYSGAGGAAGFRANTDADLPSEIAYEDENNVFTARQDIDNNNALRLFEPDGNGTNYLEFIHGGVDRTVDISLSWENIVGPCTGSNGGVLTLNGTAPNLTIDCEDDDAGGGASHDMLSATHTDTLAAAVVRGGMMVGNATPAWALVTIGGANTVWASDGTDPAWTTLAKAHLPAVTVYTDQANTYTAGQKQTVVNSAGTAGFNTTPSADPSSPADGDVWIDSTSFDLQFRSNSVSRSAERLDRKNAASGYAGLDGSTKLALAQGQEVWAIADLSDVAGDTGTGDVVRTTSPTIVTPTIAATGWTNANHAHAAANSGGQIPIGNTTGDLAASRVDDGGAPATQALYSGAGGAAGFRANTDADLPAEIAYEDENNVFTARQDIDNNNALRLFEPDGNGTNYLEFIHGGVDRTVDISLSWENIVGPCTGSNGGVLTLNGTAPNLTIDCEDDDAGGGASHDILSATHTDSLAAAVVRGGMMVGNATPAWALVTVGGANTVWASDGTDPAWTTLAKAHLPAVTVYTDQANTYTAGQKQIFTNSAATAGANLATSADPSALAHGDIWINGSNLRFRDATVTQTVERIALKNASNGYAGLDGSTKLALAQGQEVWAIADLSDVAATTGTGDVVRTTSPTIVTPVISSTGFTTAQHAHAAANSGGTLTTAALPNSILVHKCNFVLFDDTGLSDTDDIPSVSNCSRPGRAITITEVMCAEGTSTINLQRDDGSAANICTSNLVCTAAGATCTLAAAEDNFASTDRLDFVMVTAVGNQVSLLIEYTVD